MITSLLVIIPLGSAFLVALIGGKIKRFPDVFSNLATLSSFLASLISLVVVYKTGVYVYKVGGWLLPYGIAMVLDGLASFMAVTVNFVAFIISIFCVSYMRKYTAKWKFYTLFLLMLAGMNGVIISGDIFNLFVFLEIASVASYALVAYGVEAEELEASFKYIVMSSVASLFILLGIAFLYSYASTLNMADLAIVLQEKGTSILTIFVGILFLIGFGLKAAIVPFHAWLPDAHPAAPAPVSSALSGVLIKTLGVYALLRVFYNILGVNQTFLSVFLFLGALSIIVGALLALGQMDFKRLLAYSSINQVGYIILGVGLNTPLGILGAVFHLFNHSIFKSLLFLNSGAVEYATGSRDLKEMGGLRERMPVTSSTNLVASMSICGIPPFNGFFSKVLIILACVEKGFFGYASIAVIGSILTLAYFTKLYKMTFLGKLKDKYRRLREVPFFMKLSMIILAGVCILGGLLLIPEASKYFLGPAKEVLVRGLQYKNFVFVP